MNQVVVQATCPGCKQILRIPLDWVDQSMKCKHCGLIFQAHLRSAAVASRTAVAAIPLAVPATAAAAFPVAAAARANGSRVAIAVAPRRRSAGGAWWKGALIALFVVGAALGVGVLAAPYLSQFLGQPSFALVKADTKPEGPPVLRPASTGPKKPIDDLPTKKEPPATTKEPTTKKEPPATTKEPTTPPVKPKEPPPPPMKEPPVKPNDLPTATGPFPHRALIVSVNSYLYFNPINYGVPGVNAHSVHTLPWPLNRGLHMPVDQVVELSDAIPDMGGKGGRPMNATNRPLKPVIEQTISDFVQTSRGQDHIILLLICHTVEMDDQVYLVPIEGERDNKESLIPLSWLYDQLANCRAREKVLILDTCRFDPARGFERPGSGVADAKVEGAMTPKIDAALQNPPPGVQVWSACVGEQHSLEYENNGVFIEALWDTLNKFSSQGTIQKPDSLLPLEKVVELVNSRMAAELKPYGKTQTSRLTGKAPEAGAPYDPTESAARKVEPKMPFAAGGVADLASIRQILQEIDVPPVKRTRDDMLLRAESMPAVAKVVLDAYAPPDDAETDFRKAVKEATKVLNAMVKGKRLREEWHHPADENKFKQEITDYQRKELAEVQYMLDEALKDLKKAGVPEERAKEKSRRWLAHYDYVLARLNMQLAFFNEYQGLLGSMKKQLPDIDTKIQNGWRVASLASAPTDSTAKKQVAESRKILEKIVKDYPDTPWAVLSKRDRLTSLGMEWRPDKLDRNP